MLPDAVMIAIVIALVGWFATLAVIGGSRLSAVWKQVLLVPSWIPWVALAMGSPVVRGSIDFSGAIGIAGAMTIGIMFSIVATQRRER
jgi:hypothetical protein